MTDIAQEEEESQMFGLQFPESPTGTRHFSLFSILSPEGQPLATKMLSTSELYYASVKGGQAQDSSQNFQQVHKAC